MNYEIVVNGELYHHGILGQRWGVRRFQNKDGTLTSAGKQRYNVDIETAKKNLNMANKDYIRNPYNKKAILKFKLAQKKLEDEKVKAKLNNETKKSKSRLKLEAKYKNKGMNDEEAEIAAYKHDRTKKIIAAVGAVTVASAAAYVAYKHYDKVTDKVIKSDTPIHNISQNPWKSNKHAFYASYKKSDVNTYKGLYGDTLNKNHNIFGTKNVYDTTFKYESNLKVASRKSGKETLEKLMKTDKDFNRNVQMDLLNAAGDSNRTPKDRKRFEKAYFDAVKGDINYNVYDMFNKKLVYHDEDREKLNTKFYDELEKKGYSAVQDVNDKLYSGYNTKNPIVMFGNKSYGEVVNRTKLDQEEIDKYVNRFYAKQYAKSLSGGLASGYLSGKTVNSLTKAYDRKQNDKYVQEYRKKNPNTKLSYNEILEERVK